MKRLEVTTAKGVVLDTITVVKGRLRYDTEVARDMVDMKNALLKPKPTAEETFSELTGWSNGYISFLPVDDDK